MITRTTTIGTLKNYRYSLNTAYNTMAYTMNKVGTERYFNSYAEDPALATRCFQMRRSFLRTNSQLAVNESTAHKYDVAWKALDSVTTDLYKITDDASFASILRGENDADASGRNALGQSLAAKALSMVQTMNSRYGENYIFAGADHLEVPFTWGPQQSPNYIAEPDASNPDHEACFQYKIDPANAQNGELFTNDAALANQVPMENPDYDEAYTAEVDAAKDRGDDVEELLKSPHYGKYLTASLEGTNDPADAQMVPEPTETYDPNSEFKYLKADGSGTNDESEARSVLYYRGVEVDSMNSADLEKMDYFTKDEKRYLDLGLGHKEQNGEAVSSTVFDSALQGVYYLGGYGTEERTYTMGQDEYAHDVTATVPNNIISIVNRMSEILMNCDPDDGSWASTEEQEEFFVLANKFEETVSLVGQRYAEMDTQAAFLRDNSELLTDTATSLSEQITELEHVEAADAITEFIFARYVYDAALKVGNSVLSQSLMDYMNF